MAVTLMAYSTWRKRREKETYTYKPCIPGTQSTSYPTTSENYVNK